MGLAVVAYFFCFVAFAWSVFWVVGLSSAMVTMGQGILFLFLVSFYWVHQVLVNTVHTTTAGKSVKNFPLCPLDFRLPNSPLFPLIHCPLLRNGWNLVVRSFRSFVILLFGRQRLVYEGNYLLIRFNLVSCRNSLFSLCRLILSLLTFCLCQLWIASCGDRASPASLIPTSSEQ